MNTAVFSLTISVHLLSGKEEQYDQVFLHQIITLKLFSE